MTSPDSPRRKRLRLEGYDYAQAGAYFVTICTQHREAIFGQIQNGEMAPNRFGWIVQKCWHDLPNHYPHITLDAFMVMPNHVHGIIVIRTGGRRGGSSTITRSIAEQGREIKGAPEDARKTRPHGTTTRHGLPEVMRALKTFSARRINAMRKTTGTPVWQRSYYEHIIRDEQDWTRIRDYILTNPQNWQHDNNFPNHNDPGAGVRAGH